MNLLKIVLAMAAVAAGVLLSALNPAVVELDFYFWQVSFAIGPALLLALLIGALFGGIAVALGTLRMRSRRRGDNPAAKTPADEDVTFPPSERA